MTTRTSTRFLARPLTALIGLLALIALPTAGGCFSGRESVDGIDPATTRGHLTIDDILSPQPTGPAEPVLPGGLTSRVIEPGIDFDEALVSWNIQPATNATIELRVARRIIAASAAELAWSPWMYVGRTGPSQPAPGEQRTITSDLGKIDVDYFRAASGVLCHALQYRVLYDTAGASQTNPVHRVTITFTNVAKADAAAAKLVYNGQRSAFARGWASASEPAPIALDVPLRSQRTERPEIAGRICSPASVAMVLAFHGANIPVLDVANTAYDQANDLYGNWPRNVQAAYQFGISGYITRFATWRQVEDCLALGWPIIASIQTKPGELRNAPYTQTDGHLIVIRGMDSAGNLLVNDPAAETPDKASVVYNRDDLTRVWLQRTLGTAYVLQGKP